MRMAALSASNARIQVRPTILYIVLLQLALSVAATSLNEVADAIILQKKGRLEQREFDYLVLALQWPGTICRGTHRCCSSNACCRRSRAFADFTIHGLWPDYNDGSWPSCCTRSDFDVEKIRTLLHTMKQYWPSLSCNSPSTCHGTRGSFWAHEEFVLDWTGEQISFEKHGTCSYPIARDEYSYFLTALTMYFRYNVTEVLNDAGFVPSNTEKYPLGGIISAIENAFHATPLLVCSRGAVEELRLCFYKDLKPRDCVRTNSKNVLTSSKFSCPSYVSLPAYDPEDWIFDGITSTNSSTQAHLSG